MEKELPVSFVLPMVSSPLKADITLRSLDRIRDQIQLVGVGSPGEQSRFTRFPHQFWLSGETPRTLPVLLNQILPHLRGTFVAVLAPGVEISASLTDVVASRGEKSGADYLYGDYWQLDQTAQPRKMDANPCPDDISEREDWGPLEFYRVEALRQLGGCDESLKYRVDYDLRLKLTDKKPAEHILEALCTAPYHGPDSEPGSEALFFPGRGKFGGFSYLFMDQAEEKEIENIFYAALRRRNAYLAFAPGGRFSPRRGGPPRVSVIIPVHNRADFLPLAIASVQRGLFEDFEIIVVDNASTDNTLEVARELSERDPRVKVISLPDNVIARALNAGVRQGKGEYVAQLDSDDEYTPDTLEVMVRCLDENPGWALAISYYELMDVQGKTLEDFGIIKHLEYNRNNILRVDGAGAVRVWRRDAIVEFDGFNETDFGHYGEDYDLVLKVGEKYEVGRVHQVLYRYRRHPGNSDILRPHTLKIKNKTLARQRAIQRRQILNQQAAK